MKLEEYREQFGWSRADLARKAELDDNTVTKAERGEEVSGRTARALAQAISEELKQTTSIQQIDGLRVKVYRTSKTSQG